MLVQKVTPCSILCDKVRSISHCDSTLLRPTWGTFLQSYNDIVGLTKHDQQVRPTDDTFMTILTMD